MKWLKIKRCLKISSVIICSIFIFSNNVKAEEFSANNKTFNTKELDNILTEKYSSLDLEEYVYKYAFINDNKMYYVLDNHFQGYKVNTSDWVNEKSTSYLRNEEYIRTLSFGSGGYLFDEVYAYVYDFSNDSYELSSPNWNKRYIVGSYDSNNMTREEIVNWHEERILYANTNITTYYSKTNEKLNFYLSYEDFEKEFFIEGYIKVTIPKDKVIGIVSGIKKGRIWYKANPRVNSYYGKANSEWNSIEWPKPITDLRKATFADNPDNPHLNSLYYYYDFDLSTVQDSQFIMINKYTEKVCNLPEETIEECNERYNYLQELWIPEEAYFSLVTVTENENGGNDFDFDFKNPDTNDIENSHTENESGPNNEVGTFFDYLYKLLNNFQNGFIYISECFTSFFNELPFMIQAILGLAFTIGIVKFIFELFK